MKCMISNGIQYITEMIIIAFVTKPKGYFLVVRSVISSWKIFLIGKQIAFHCREYVCKFVCAVMSEKPETYVY